MSRALILLCCAAFMGGLPIQAEMKLVVPSGYLPDIPMLVRVEIYKAGGSYDRDQWDAEAILTVDEAGVTLSTNRVVLRNGLGSALVLFGGGGDFTLHAQMDEAEVSRTVQDLSASPVTTVASGSLSGSETTWAGVIRVTGDVTVPAGHILRIEAGAWVLMEGVDSGTDGADLLVLGEVESLGTETNPITITSAGADVNWGQIRHTDADPSTYRYTIITKGGRAPAEGHTGTGPVFRPNGSTLVFESCTIGYALAGNTTVGKIMQASQSELTFRDCLLTRARMGPEINATGLLCTNTYILHMNGPDDSDGIYLHDANGRSLRFIDCVLAYGDDDGIDTLGADVEVDGCIIRDWSNRNEDAKGISVFNGATRVSRSILVDCTVGISAKWSSGAAARVIIDHCVLTGNLTNALAQFKSNAPGPFVDYRITNSILTGLDSIQSDFAPTNFTIVFCNLSEPWPGEGNLQVDPRFVNEAGHDYRLQADSPCIDMGDPASPLDPDGTRTDMGVFPFLGVPLAPMISHAEYSESFSFSLIGDPGRTYEIQASSDLINWEGTGALLYEGEPVVWRDTNSPNFEVRFYRARLAVP